MQYSITYKVAHTSIMITLGTNRFSVQIDHQVMNNA